MPYIDPVILGVNDPPPGTDEIVAMAKIVTYLEEGYELPNGDKMVRILKIVNNLLWLFIISFQSALLISITFIFF